MPPSRREILLTGSAAALALSACDGTWRGVSRLLGATVPESISPPRGAEIDPIYHALNRMAFGPWPGDVERVRAMGLEAYVGDQLAPGGIPDAACEVRARRFESIHCDAGNLREFERRVVEEELSRSTILRAVYSRRQLFEVMVEFWTDHFNIDRGKGLCAWLKTADDRDVVRRHALGRFRDLVAASAVSPAMLVYLDGASNRREGPNENYARELMELHTLGVHGGYIQRDVMEAARCLTGWDVHKGRPRFDPGRHDPGRKEVLGAEMAAGGGERDLDRLVDVVCGHPSTARHIAWKLCRRFVAEPPPEDLVARAAGQFTRTRGDIPSVLRTILLSPEFAAAKGTKFKRPFRYVVSALRALGADTNAGRPILEALNRLGQAPFSYPTPDGYPEEEGPWLGGMLWRWNFAAALVSNAIHGTTADAEALARAAGGVEGVARHLLGRDPAGRERIALDLPPREAVGLLLASPGFQRC